MSVAIPRDRTSPERLSARARLTLAVLGGGLLVLLTMAAWLKPDPRGLGTHQQLGLPPCTVRMLFGLRCPTCGMTTSWSLVAHGQWLAALRTQAIGTLLALTALAAVPWLLVSSSRGRWWGVQPNEFMLTGAALVVVLMAIVEWILRLSAG